MVWKGPTLADISELPPLWNIKLPLFIANETSKPLKFFAIITGAARVWIPNICVASDPSDKLLDELTKYAFISAPEPFIFRYESNNSIVSLPKLSSMVLNIPAVGADPLWHCNDCLADMLPVPDVVEQYSPVDVLL